MPTFKPIVYPGDKRRDNTFRVYIQVTHHRQSRRLPTNIYVTPADIVRGRGKIKNQKVIDQANQVITRWRSIASGIELIDDELTVDQIVSRIKFADNDECKFKLDFVDYGRKWAATMKPSTANCYMAALSALVRFTGSPTLDISAITANFLRNFENFIANEPDKRTDRNDNIQCTKANGRSISSYPAFVRAIHNHAKEEFNDEDNGIVRIPQSPFKQYKVKSAPAPKHRALPVETIQKILDVPNKIRHDGTVDLRGHNLARDCFAISFGLIGMNAADLLSCPAQDISKGVIVYNRQKTADRRRYDKAEMHVRIEPCIMPLVKKYLDHDSDKLFCFHRLYANNVLFSCAINRGLLRIEKEIESNDHLTTYTARHSWATIARSALVGIDKYTVHEALNHVDESMKITDIYIARDWSNIWNANEKVLALFDWDAINNR